jgi:hypothetical protein
MSESDPTAFHDRVSRYRARVAAERTRLRDALGDPAAHQRRVLDDLLAFNAGTRFGTAHGFRRIRTLDDFRKAVPIHTYADLEPWIERAAAGEPGVLSADAPAVYFTSSGSTGAHKKIPVTPGFVRHTFLPFYFAAWAPLLEHFPEVLDRPDAVLNLKHDPLTAPPTLATGQPHVGASQVDFGERFGEPLAAEPGSFAPWATLPLPLAADDHEGKMYARLRLAVESDVRLVIGINPAMVAALPFQLRLWWPRLLRDVRDGTLGGIPVRDPNPRRAAELEQAAHRAGVPRPAVVWPRLKALFCWTTGMASLYLPLLREEYGTAVTALPAPVAASEGPVATALDRHPTAGSPVVTASVLEFADADEDIRPETATWDVQQLDTGRDYHVVFSHIGGLYRYAVGDVVRVVDRVDGVPRLEYAGRGTRSDAAGERLRDAQVIRSLGRAAAAGGLALRNAACRVEPDPGTGRPGYLFALAPAGAWSEDERLRFGARLDEELRHGSADYRSAREAARLAAPRVVLLDGDAFDRDWLAAVADGTRPTQVKDRLFRQDSRQWDRLTAPGHAPAGRGE